MESWAASSVATESPSAPPSTATEAGDEHDVPSGRACVSFPPATVSDLRFAPQRIAWFFRSTRSSRTSKVPPSMASCTGNGSSSRITGSASSAGSVTFSTWIARPPPTVAATPTSSPVRSPSRFRLSSGSRRD